MNYQYIKNNSVVKKNKYHLIEENQNVGKLLKKMGGTFYKKNNKWSFSKELIDSYCLQEISETILVSENQHPKVQSESENDQSDQLESENDQSDQLESENDQSELENDQLDQVESENEYDDSELHNNQVDQYTQTENPIMYHHLPSRIFYDIITEYLTTDTVF